MPYGTEIGEDGIWRQILTRIPGPGRRPALFLDRDGVVVDEVHYLHKIQDMKLSVGAAALVRRANALNIPCIIVTNQAGIGRGIFDWQAFIAVQDAMLDALAGEGAYVNAVYACPHIAGGKAPYGDADHPARKPGPGMLLSAADMLPIDLQGSWIIGDRATDIEAARRAGCAGGVHVLAGHGAEKGERTRAMGLRTPGFDVQGARDIVDAGDMIPLFEGDIGT
ncbi:MAG: HAD family hydrolase [Rhodospirillales bacterium]